MSFLVNTNVFSEKLKRRPDEQVVAWLRENESSLSPFDGLIAATAVRYDLTVVTRNESDFRHAPVGILNPFER
ncbi:MAG: putative nucleic acid-binding protein [Verrucomicrobiales bacterium]|jgi:predicted nucleic acid-binding protein